MPYCRKCGADLQPGDKFCPDCGAKIETRLSGVKGGKHPEGMKKEEPVIPEQPKADRFKSLKTALAIIGSIVGGILLFYSIDVLIPTTCSERFGMVLCGHCGEDILLSDNPYAGMCRYCPQGYTCSGDVCGDLKCKGGGGGGGGTIAQEYCSSGYCLSNGRCCPSSSRYYCEGKCYGSSAEANSASSGRCTSFTVYC